MMKEIDIVFRLVRGALEGTVPEVGQMDAHRWWRLFRLMQQNHVAAMTADTMAALEVPREVKIPWLAERDKAERWHRYQEEVQQEIVGTVKQHGIETLVLKGTHTSQYYPTPELREFGDLDLYFFDRHDEADKVAAENEEAKRDRAVKKAAKKINEQVEKTTLGDVFGNLKEELEKKEEKGQE